MKTFTGGCHCGRVRYQVEVDLSTASECNCSVCAKKGFLHLIVARDSFQLLSGQEDLTTYEFNTRTAKHLFCRHCGMHSFYVPRSDPDKIDVNARCLDGVDPQQVRVTQFDGKHWEDAIKSRKPG